MKYDVTDKLIEIREKYRKKRRWQTIFMSLSTVVVFCVAYALVLPAITMERATTVADSSIPNTAAVTKFSEIDGSGSTYYVLYVRSSNRRYALDGNGNAVQVTESNGTVSWSTASEDMFWSFSKQSDGTYKIQNAGTSKYIHPCSSALLTSGDWTTTVTPSSNSSTATFYGNSRYARYSGGKFSQSTSSTAFYIAAVEKTTCNIWYDGTNGGIMSLTGAANTRETVETGQEITLPVSWQSPSKYTYTLRGWYDITGSKYYAPGETVTVTSDMVLYADWEAATYDVGLPDEHVVESLDTSDFITTHMFDYSSIFNMHSVTYSGSSSGSSHSEKWSLTSSGTVPYNNQDTLNFIFRDWDTSGTHISYPSGASASTENENKSTVTSGILDTRSTLIDILFATNNAYDVESKTGIVGKSYVGKANYFYQYDSDTSSDFYGYYYYDSKLNAASYNQSEERFYIYDYLERTSDSWKDGGDGEYSDFLPYNSPYIHANDTTNSVQVLRKYDAQGNITDSGANYQYDAKYNGQSSLSECAGTNYWFGMSSDIRFYLPNDSGTGGNIATTGKQMVFSFSGDDDVWVFVDDVLVLDIGGIHGIHDGEINFSTGEVTVSDEQVTTLMDLAASTNSNIDKAGEHHLTIYYLERGGSQSNCAIYFNIAPRYFMKLEKTDAATTELLNGAQFSVYADAACTIPATLWANEEAFNQGEDSINTFTIENGKGSIWGFCGGNTYYIKETKPPDGYLLPSGVIRMTLDNHGTATYDIDVISDGEEVSQGFRVIGFRIDDITHEIYLVISNRLEDTIDVSVKKVWDVQDGTEIPDSVEVYLEANDEKVGDNIILNQENDWSFSWSGLSKKNAEDADITYNVKEVPVSGYSSQVLQGEDIVSYIQWIPVQTLVDGETHLLVSEQGVLTVTGNDSLAWVDLEAARTDVNAQWKATAYGLGFRLENAAGARIAYDTTNKTFYVTTENEGLQELHYNEHGLRVYHDNEAYYLNVDAEGNIGSASQDSGIQFELKEKLTVEGIEFTITNTPLGKQTLLAVKKIWSDGAETHSEDAVTVYLKADDSDTGYELVLNEENNWMGQFEGLPYYQEDGVTKIKYSVVEKEVRGYTTEYSEVIEKENEMTYEVTVTNNLIVYELPVTGGIGTIPLYMFGVILLVLGSILLYKKYEKQGENKR